MKRSICTLLSCIFLLFSSGQAQPVAGDAVRVNQYRRLFWDSIPKPVSWVTDLAGLFSSAQRNELDSMINDFEQQSTVEIAIITLDTFCVAAESFDALTLRIARQWGVGKKEKNNGILISISPGYRKMRVANGTGISKVLSDSDTKKLIDEHFTQYFKEGNYFAGTRNGLIALMTLLKNRLSLN